MGLVPNAKELADEFSPVIANAEDKLTAELTGQIIPALRDALVQALDGLTITLTVTKKGTPQ